VELIRSTNIRRFVNGGVTSDQLLFPENSTSERLTITRVTLVPGAKNPPHAHANSEQVWIALQGVGTLLLGGGKSSTFVGGDVVRFEPGDIHGLENTGSADFTYVSVTSPPINFRAAYAAKWPASSGSDAA
jgi:quercetin dioxygenase-like cupin family protein